MDDRELRTAVASLANYLQAAALYATNIRRDAEALEKSLQRCVEVLKQLHPGRRIVTPREGFKHA